MANDPNVHQVSPAVSLFQKAHGRMTTVQRIDEQVAALLEQRRKIQEELMGLFVEVVGEGGVVEGFGGDFEPVLTDRLGPAVEGAFLFTFDTSQLFLAAFSSHGISQRLENPQPIERCG